MEKVIGTFDKMDYDTYAECARVTLSKMNPDGRGAVKATVEDGILYLWRRKGNGYAIFSANSTFDLTISSNI